MIIVEGPDGAGKSTLCRELASKFHLQIHVKEPKDGPVNARQNTYVALQRAVDWDEPVKVYDRLYFSELVYGDILRGKVDFSEKEKIHIESVLIGLKCPIIFCAVPTDLLRRNIREDPKKQLGGVSANIDKIDMKYLGIGSDMARRGKTIHLYDYTKATHFDKVCGVVEAYLTFRGAGADGRTA